MAVTIVTHGPETGARGGSGPVFGQGGRPSKVIMGTIAFDSSYPTGGELITEIFDFFNNAAGTSRLEGIVIEQPLTGAQTGKFAKVDKANKKVLLYTNASPAVEVVNATDQSAISGTAALHFIAWGPR